MSFQAHFRRLSPALGAVAVFSVTALTLSPSAAARWGGDEPCVSPSGMTLKQEYGYSVDVVTSACTQVPVGEAWAPSVSWVMDSRYEQRPPGFTTDEATPIDDFRAKLKSIEVTVDPGSAYQSNRSFPADNKIWTGELPSAPGLPAINTVDLGSLAPLPLGTHTVEVTWNLAGPVCDGFTANQGTSCLPQTPKLLVKRITFNVVDPHSNRATQS